jgi:hypothetical protein
MSLWQQNISIGYGVSDYLFRFPPGVINRHSFVLANICEISAPQGEPLDFPFMGAATMGVHNIVPLDDGNLIIRLEADWDSVLNARVQIFVFD